MTIHFSTKALKDLTELPSADADRVMEAISRLEGLPHAGRFAEMAKAAGCNVTAIPGGFRLRHGNWRALLEVEDAEVTVQRVKNRRDAY